jgi:hypothetical protein
VSGVVDLSSESGNSGVTLTFRRVSGRGILPVSTETDRTGAWSKSGFDASTTYEVIPSKEGWRFEPDRARIDGPTESLDFVGTATQFSLSGSINLEGRVSNAGVVVTFSRVSGSGTTPARVTTSRSGDWSQTGFAPGSVYLAQPQLDGWQFSPSSRRLSRSTEDVDFVGTPAQFRLAGSVDLEGQIDNSGVSIRFRQTSGVGSAPAPVTSSRAGSWSHSGFSPGRTYLVQPALDGWRFVPISRIVSGADVGLDFRGTRATYTVSGDVSLPGRSDNRGVTLRFRRLSGTGPTPSPTSSSTSGAWRQTGFAEGSTYQVTASLTGWAFTASSINVSRGTTSANFVGQGDGVVASGKVELLGESVHSGVTLTFSRFSGSGSVPESVISARDGNWIQHGFSPGTMYRVEPTKDGWAFSPSTRFVLSTRDDLDFTGTALSQTPTMDTIPSTQVYGFNNESDGPPDNASFSFDSSRDDLLLTWFQWSESEDAVSVWLNDRLLWPANHGESPDWSSWYGNIEAWRLRSTGNVLEFRHERNAGRRSQYEEWGIKDVELWKSYLAKPAGARAFAKSEVDSSVGFGKPFPSPFNSTLTIPVTVDSPALVTVDVMNLLGQRVTTLHDGPLGQGSHMIQWRGVDSEGHPVTSGLYLISMRSGPLRRTESVVFLR